MIGSYYQTLGAVGPGIDISHYGAPYKQMLGVPALGSYTEQPGEHFEYATAGVGMLYRYGAALGVEPWTGKPSDDPRMVKQFTVVKSTYRVRNLGGDRTEAKAADAILAKARALYRGNTVRKIGTTGWTSGGKVGFEVILAQPMRAGEIKSKNFQAGQQAASQMGGNVSFYDASTSIPQSAFQDAPPSATDTPETTPSSTPAEEAAAEGGLLTRKVAGLPVWALGLIGIGVTGGVAVLVMRKKKPKPVAANRRRRKRRRRSTRRRR